MTSPQKRKGDEWERRVVELCRAAGFDAERIPAGSTNDRGDIWTLDTVIECKNHKQLSLGPWLTELTKVQEFVGKPFHVLAVKRRQHPPESGFAVMELSQALELIRLASSVLAPEDSAPV